VPNPLSSGVADGTRLLQEILVEHSSGAVLITWSLIAAPGPVAERGQHRRRDRSAMA